MITKIQLNDTSTIEMLDPIDIKISRLPVHSFQEAKYFDYRPETESAWKATYDFSMGKLEFPFLYLVGGCGLGKTHLLYQAGWRFLKQGRRCLYYKVEDLMDEMRESYQYKKKLDPSEFNQSKYAQIFGRLEKIPLLLLDDLGAHQETDWATTKLDQVIDARYENRMPTMVTSNKLDISERIRDRFKQGKIILLKGDSYRGIIANHRTKRKGDW